MSLLARCAAVRSRQSLFLHPSFICRSTSTSCVPPSSHGAGVHSRKFSVSYSSGGQTKKNFEWDSRIQGGSLLLLSVMTSSMAWVKKRSASNWFVSTLIFGRLSPLYLLLLPNRTKEHPDNLLFPKKLKTGLLEFITECKKILKEC